MRQCLTYRTWCCKTVPEDAAQTWNGTILQVFLATSWIKRTFFKFKIVWKINGQLLVGCQSVAECQLIMTVECQKSVRGVKSVSRTGPGLAGHSTAATALAVAAAATVTGAAADRDYCSRLYRIVHGYLRSGCQVHISCNTTVTVVAWLYQV